VVQRLQHRRGTSLPEGAPYVGRPSRWGNPYVFDRSTLKEGRVLVASRAEAVRRYEADLLADPERVAEARRLLAGRDLACYCLLDGPCHADVLLRIANDNPVVDINGDADR